MMTHPSEKANSNVIISVVTPVFNGEKHIAKCLENIIDQDCPVAEHIIVDGGSSDSTIAIVQMFARRHTHIRYLSESDEGQSDAMNKGRKLATGRILATLNVDDYYEKNALNSAIELFSSLPNDSLLVGNCNVRNEHGDLLYVNKPRHLSLISFLMGFDYPVNPAAYFYGKETHDRAGGFDVNEHFAMDAHFLFKAVDAANVTYVNQIFGNFVLLPEAKTTQDKQGAGTSTRMAAIKRQYRSQLPAYQRAMVIAGTPWVTVYRKLSKSLRSPRQTLERYVAKLRPNRC